MTAAGLVTGAGALLLLLVPGTLLFMYSAQAQTSAPSAHRVVTTDLSAEARTRRPRVRIYREDERGVYPSYNRPRCGTRLHRALCAGIPAERDGDRSADELLLASRLTVPIKGRCFSSAVNHRYPVTPSAHAVHNAADTFTQRSLPGL
jgi:hypothetical protein